MQKNLLIIFLACGFPYSLLSQQAFNFIGSPGPSSQSGKPVTNINAFTGKLGLSIPIYQYKSSSSALAFSVSIDYSSGGLNLNQNPSSVGAGWNLNAGGNIRRIINGLPDDLKRTAPSGLDRSGFAYSPPISSTFCPLHYEIPGYYDNPDNKVTQDSEPDEFQFSFLGKQGSFVIAKGSLPENGYNLVPSQPLTSPQSNLKFGYYSANVSDNIKTNLSAIIVTDDNGIEYTFSGIETTKRKTSRTINDGNNNYHYEYDFINEFYTTAWNLTKIKDLNSNEEITLEYENYFVNTKAPKSLTVFKKNSTILEWYNDDRNYEQGNMQRLKVIRFNNGDIVSFDHDNINRCDYLSDKALNKIRIENSNGNTISFNLKFVYYQGGNEIDYLTCSSANDDVSRSKWLFLRSVERNVSSLSTKICDFEYIRSSVNYGSSHDNRLPTRKEMKNQDLWGFYNGGEVTPRTCPAQTALCQSPDAGAAEIGSLKRIVYPSGGSSSIEYEGNTIFNNTLGYVNSYGIRVKKITENDGISTANNIIKEYKYLQADGKSSGFSMPEPPTVYTNQMSVYNNGSPYINSYQIFSSSTVAPLIPIGGSPVAYSRVEELSILGKTVTEFRSLSDQAPLQSTYTYPFSNKNRIAEWAYGVPKKQLIYHTTGNLVKSSENTYDVFINTLSQAEFKSMKTAYQIESDAPIFTQNDDPTSCAQATSIWQFQYDTYYPSTGRTELKETIEKNYLKDGRIMENKVQYEYDANKFTLKKVTSYNSVNDKLEKIMFYPYEHSISSNTYKLLQKNIETMPVSSISILTKQNGNKYITGFEKSEFQQMPDYSIRPFRTLTMKSKNVVSIASTKTTFTPEEDYGEASQKLTTDVTFNNYDSEGKTLQTTSNQTVSSAIWDNDQKIVIAKANASFNDIAYSSFETIEKGNWSYTGNGFFEITAPAGKKCYSLTGNTISKSGLASTTDYIVSYRSKNGSFNVNGTSPFVTAIAINGWTYYKHKLTGNQTVTISGTGLIDELRLHPETSRMTSITYEPLLGVTSESGTEEEITKYEYDSYGRVTAIKNQFGNIVKVFCYNSLGQPSPCGDAAMYRNSATSQNFYKSNCSSGNFISYAVPIGRYTSFISQADADKQAEKDTQTFGKSFADRSSTCTPVTVYARLSYENYTYSASYVYADIVVRFYSNAQCTQPLNVSGLPILYSSNWTDYSGSYTSSGTINATGGSNAVLFKNTLVQWEETNCDYGYWPCYNYTYTTDYSLNGSAYYQVAY